jgi:hypothetical protein
LIRRASTFEFKNFMEFLAQSRKGDNPCFAVLCVLK